MKHYTEQNLNKLPRRYRAHLINSATGYKSANLIGTVSENGISNLAIFNSVIHIGSDPALLGFILRPLTVKRDTYQNIKETGFFTVNQIHKNIVERAHQTSASYEKEDSEFSKTGLTESYQDDFIAPYVEQSFIKIGCHYVNEYLIKENGCILIIGAIDHIYVSENNIATSGNIQLDEMNTVSTVGLDTYALPTILARFSYAKPDREIETLL